MIRITCTSCHKPLSLDETKLPMKEVTFPCPVCKTKLAVDRRALTPEASEAAADEPAPEGPPVDDHENEVGAKAFLVGNDNAMLRQSVKLLGFLPLHYATADQARERFMQEMPQLVILNPAQVTAPPLEAMQPIIGLAPADRRRSFFVLVAENLRTLDGNAAFLYGVNLVIAPKDLTAFSQIYRDAHTYHERLYSNVNALRAAMETL